ncbi:MAG: TonB-dependent receptor plug domain-containing protein [Pseudomonadota bacterium]
MADEGVGSVKCRRRVRGAVGVLSCGCALAVAPHAFAQSVSVDEAPPVRERPVPAAVPAGVPAVEPKPAEPVVPPRASSTPIAYPAQGQGEHDIVLELTISAQGAVSAARVVGGAEPFATRALEASKSWLFEPAHRGELAIASKIRFAVHFAPALVESAPAEPAAAAQANQPPSASAAAPKMLEILVVGQREPIRHTLAHADVRDMPGAFGDPYRAIEALPGVVPIVSGLPYFYVRGAPPGNVGYFFDGIPVPYLYHFAAGPGVLQPAFVDHVDLYPGAYPARYGRFAGAIVAGEMAPPSYRFKGEATIRLVDSGATIEAPFASGRGSAMVGGRFSYTAAVLSLIVPDISLSYWDYQARARYELDAKNSVELLSFGAGDFLSDVETDSVGDAGTGPLGQPAMLSERRRKNTVVDVNFHRLDLRWDHHIENGNWRNALLFGLDRTGADNGNVTVRNHMIGARSEYRQALSPGLTLRAGGDALFEALAQQVDNQGSVSTSRRGSTFDGPPNGIDNTSNDADFGFDRSRIDFTAGAWVDAVLAATPEVEVTPGLRADLFVSGGRLALSLDPRVSARYALTRKLSVTHGLALVHQAPSFVVPVPGFKPSLAGGLQSALQHSASVSYALPAGFESSLAVFQNAFFNMTDLIGLIQLQNSTGQSVTDIRATGHAYGAELSIRRSLARNVGGFLSYTLSRSVRSTGNLQGPATSDRTHVLNLGLSGSLGHNWRLGGRFLFYSGIPVQVASIRDAQAPPRTPPFWRLDVKLQKRWYIKAPDAWWGVVLEVLNTTLNKETVSGDCVGSLCTYQSIGPVTVPSLGAEGAF